jgi:hypothetical protein
MLTTSTDARARLLKLHPDDRIASALIANNFHSAVQIAGTAPSHFVRLLAPHLGGDVDTARDIHDRATQVRSTLLHAWANVRSVVQSPQYKALAPANDGDDIGATFQQLPSYAELFGSQDYCECDEFRSIFGPAAYLVDLLRIIDTYIAAPNHATIPADMALDHRRGDLGTMLLTFANTNDTFPQLRIVNERLGTLACDQLKVPAGSELFQVLATLTYPFNTPFHLALERIDVQLSQVNLALADVYTGFGAAHAETARARLGLLAPAAYQFVTTSLAAKPDELAAAYGVAASALLGLADADALLAATGLALDQLQDLLAQGLDTAEQAAGVAANLFINGGLGGKVLAYVPADPNIGAARIINLDKDALDRLGRFVRLAARLGWGYGDLDWALRVASGGAAPAISGATLGALANMIELAGLAQADVPTVCALLGPVKTYGTGNGSVPLAQFDTIFNDPRALSGNAPYHPKGNPLNPLYTSALKTWNVASSAQADVALAAWLSGALKVQATILSRLAGVLFPDVQQLQLTVDNLSVLYRHAVLLRATGMPVDQHFLFMKLGGWWKTTFTAGEVRLLLQQATWLVGADATIYQVDYFLNGGSTVPVSPFVDPLYKFSAVAGWLDSVWQATSGLAARDEVAKLPGLLAAFFGVDTALLEAAVTLAIRAQPPVAGKTWQDEVLASASEHSQPNTYVSALLAVISRWLVLSDAIGAPLALLESLATPANGRAYGMSDPTLATVAFADVIALSTFVGQKVAFQDTSNGLIAYVELAAQKKPPSDPAAALARVTQWDVAQLRVLLPRIESLSRTAAIAALQRQFSLMRRLGANWDMIGRLLLVPADPAPSWTDYTGLADLVLSKVQGIAPAEQWPGIAAQIDGALDERVRDVLAPLVLWKIRVPHPEISSLRKLSEYMLLDVEVSGVVQVSYIRDALNAAQLYLQRCRLHLEPGIAELDIPEAWWEWMMNYRVWEANREIFLYPENYLDPTLRKSQTRLFADLRNRLQQEAVTDTTVEAAYHDYVDKLCKLAQLVYVDAYHGTVHDPLRGTVDTKFLFARTATEPYTYYYISYDTNVWSEWKQIDVTIAAALVTPVYVFNHLFLFWVELTTSKPNANDGTNNRGVAYTATIKYTFTKFDGSWIQPQALINDEVVYYMPSDTDQQGLLGPLSGDAQLFRMTDIFWNKVAVNVIPDSVNESERVCVMYGPLLDKGTSSKALVVPKLPDPAINQISSQLGFEQKVFDISTTYNQLVRAPVLGQLPMMNTTVLDPDLNLSCLMRPNEVVMLEKDYNENSPPLFRPEIDMLAGTLRLVAANTAFHANYLTDYTPPSSSARVAHKLTVNSFVSPTINEAGSNQCYLDLQGNNIISKDGVLSPSFGPATDLSFLFAGAAQETRDKLTFEVRKTLFSYMADPELFGALPVTASRLVSVKNQPGSFLLDTGDDCYLLTPHCANYTQLSTGTDVTALSSSPVVYAKYFAPVGTSNYEQIYKDLVGNNVVQDVNGTYGWLTTYFSSAYSLDFLFAGSSDEERAALINEVRRILLSLPSLTKLHYAGERIPHIVQPDSFVAANLQPPITSEVSRQAYHDLEGANIIDANGVVTPTFNATTDLLGVLEGAPEALRDYIRSVLLSLPKLVPVNAFVSKGGDAPASKAVFNVLVTHGIIDDTGMLSVSFSPSTDLSYLFPGSPEPARTAQIDAVRGVLQRYYDSTYQIDPHELRFDVQRVSARASSRSLSARMFTGGLPELLSLATQDAPVMPKVPFDRLAPRAMLFPPALFDAAQVDFDGPYGEYYWELFFHAPMLVAGALALNQQYDDAKRWLEYMLDPTAAEQYVQPGSFVTPDIGTQDASAAYGQLVKVGLLQEVSAGNARVTAKFTSAGQLASLFANMADSGQRQLMIREVANILANFQLAKPASHFWQFRPFRNHTLQSLKDNLTDPAQIATYNDDPFDPHAIARLRIGAYEKAVVMQYVDHLIAWGDMLFTQYTRESVNNATLLYMFANDILGDKPRDLGPMPPVKPVSFNDIKAHYAQGQIPQFLLDLEHWLPAPVAVGPASPASEAFNAIDPYFCVPENGKLDGYWDRVADRLYKIRRGLNIDGVAVPLTMFDPPLDPMALVKQAASGAATLGVAGGGLLKISSQYRFGPLFEQALQLTGSVIQLGQALLAALERGDAEQLEVLRQSQELAILDLTTTIKQKQVEQLQATLDSLVKTQKKAQDEATYYTNLDDAGLSSQEMASKICLAEAILFQSLAVPIRGIAIAGYLSPSIFGLADGGMQWGEAVASGAEISAGISQSLQLASQLTATSAEQDRRSAEWTHQADLSTQDVAILQKQIDATGTQLAMARQELLVHNKSIEQAGAVGDFLRRRFTSTELYQWMAGRVAGIYFQAYKMSVDTARTAELAYQYETGQTDSFINLGYWDSLKKGLLAGEALNFSLQQLRQAYMAGNVRRLQVSKTISLLQLDPQQILNLRTGKPASFKLTETMFDFDFPGHYARQIASVSISIPAVVGPYQNINATLTQTKNAVALTPDPKIVEYLIASENSSEPPPKLPDTLRTDWLPAQSIAISRGVNDNGMFELNFASDHYMPFEGTGAVSSWTLEIPPENNRINLDQLTDVIIELKYTALDGVGRDTVNDILRKYHVQFESKLYLDLRQMFAGAWMTFMSPQGEPATQTMQFSLTRAMFPYFKSMTAQHAAIRLTTVPGVSLVGPSYVTLAIGDNRHDLVFGPNGVAPVPASGSLDLADHEFLVPWSLEVTLANVPDAKELIANRQLNPRTFLDFEVILSYSADVLGKKP